MPPRLQVTIRRVAAAALALAAAGIGRAAAAQPRRQPPTDRGLVHTTAFVHVKLPDGIALDVPSDWHIASAASNTDLSRRSDAVLDLAEIPRGPGGVYLRAFPPGGESVASVTVSVVRRRSASQQAVADLSGARLAQVNEQYRQDLLAEMRLEPATMLDWSGAEKVRLGGLYSLVSRYTYRTPRKGPMLMESHRVFLGGGSAGLLLQASVQSGDRWWPTLRHIRKSFTAADLPAGDG